MDSSAAFNDNDNIDFDDLGIVLVGEDRRIFGQFGFEVFGKGNI